MKHLFVSLTLGCMALAFQGCHKNGSTPTASHPCKLLSATANNQGLITNYSFSYDGKGRLSSVQVSGSAGTPYTETLTYSDGYIATYTDFSGKSWARDTVNLDAGGNVASIFMWGSASTNKSSITYTRDSQGNPTQSVSVSENGTTTTTKYQYANGDLMSGATMGNPFSFDYYTDKQAAINDAQALQQFLTYGLIAYKSAHLCKSFQSGTISQSYTYTMDDKGNITDMTTTDVNTSKAVSTVHYVYDCNG